MSIGDESLPPLTAAEVAYALMSPMQFAAVLSEQRWRPAKHFAILSREFVDLVENDKADVLVVTAPPRHGKTEALSTWWPTWYMCRHPERRVILTAYGPQLAETAAKRVRDMVHRLAPVFGLPGVDPTLRARNKWQMRGTGGGMIAAGVLGGITGHGADLLIVDDYCKNQREALSQATRDSWWTWFQTTALSRLSPTGKCIVLATPWHPDDLIGRIRKHRANMGYRVRIVRLQAIYEDPTVPDPLGRELGEALWPEQGWTVERLEKIRQTLSQSGLSSWWDALYSGKPISHAGQEWPSEWFLGVGVQADQWPSRLRFSCIALDPSRGRSVKKGDYSAIVFAGVDDDGVVWVKADLERRPIPKMITDLIAMEMQTDPMVVAIEGNAWQDLLVDPYRDACRYVGREPADPVLLDNAVSKNVRISRLGDILQARRLRVVLGPGGRELINQLREWPHAAHDDGPDALEMAVRVLNIMQGLQVDSSDRMRIAEPQHVWGQQQGA